MSLTRRAVLRGSAAAVPGLALARPARAEDRVLRVGYQKASVALSLLRTQGLLEKRLAAIGYRPSWAIFTSGPPIMEALNDGAVDLAFTGEPPPIFAQAAGVPVIYAAATEPSPASVAILVNGQSSLRTATDLKGRRIAVAKGSSAHYLLVAALKKAGIAWAEITPVYLQPSDGRTALQAGAVDAWSVWDPFEAAAQAQGARILLDGTGLMANRAYYLTSRDFATKQAQALAVAIASIKEIEAWEPNHLPEIAQGLSSDLGVPASILSLWLKRQKYGVSPVTPQMIADQQKMADTFAALHLIPKPITVADAVLPHS